MQKYKQESLSAAMKESGLLIAKICACVIAGVVVIWGLVTGTETLLTALKTMHEQYDNSMCYIVCATGWFFLVLSNWLWVTYSLYKARTGSTVGGGLQFMFLLSLLAELLFIFCDFLVIVSSGYNRHSVARDGDNDINAVFVSER